MLVVQTKFQGHRPFSPEKRIFKQLYHIYGHGGHLGHQNPHINVHSFIPQRLLMLFGFNKPSSLKEENKHTESEASRTKASKWP